LVGNDGVVGRFKALMSGDVAAMIVMPAGRGVSTLSGDALGGGDDGEELPNCFSGNDSNPTSTSV
jgi:hypothetical protein